MRDPFLLPEVQVIATEPYILMQHAVRDALEDNLIVMAVGAGGTGKTLAVNAALRSDGSRAVRWEAQPRTTPKQVSALLLKKITGVDYSRDDRFSIFERLEAELGARPRPIFVDEAHDLNCDATEVLRHLWQSPHSEFPLILSGGPRQLDTLRENVMLRRRIAHAVHFEPLGLADILDVIPIWHPLYDHVDPELIQYIDERLAHGLFGLWANFTMGARKLMIRRKVRVLDYDIATAVFRQRAALHGIEADSTEPPSGPRPARLAVRQQAARPR